MQEDFVSLMDLYRQRLGFAKVDIVVLGFYSTPTVCYLPHLLYPWDSHGDKEEEHRDGVPMLRVG